jgi:hypothetical protein
MPFVKGNSGNPTGKKFGTQNKLTKELKVLLKNILANEIEQLPEHLSKIEPKERIELLIKLLPYIVPKVENETYQFGEGGQFDWS